MAARGGGDVIDWRTYGEARADIDRIVEGLENRIRETETRIIKRLDDQDRGLERGFDQGRSDASKLEERIRVLEQELATLRSQKLPEAVQDLTSQVVILRTTNKLLAGVGGVVLTLMGLAIAALSISH